MKLMESNLPTLALVLVLLWISAAQGEDTEPKSLGEAQKMAQPQLFYRGNLDDRVVTVENGARVNRDHANFVTQGPWAEVKTHKLGSRIHSITGYGLPNYTFIEGETGLILVDTGMNAGSGLELLKMKEAFSDKPIVAIIYSHHHYTGGTRPIVERYSDLDIPIYGHPDVDQNLLSAFSYMAPAALGRGAKQLGQYLPKEGPDAAFGIDEPHFDKPALNAHAHMPVSHPVADGENIVIDGLQFIFYHAVADTRDSLIIHIPELDAVVHNTAVMGFLFPMYTLRGDFYRSTPEVLESIGKLRALNSEYLIGCHGFPVSGREEVRKFITDYRDALAYIFQQTVRGINRGLAPGDIVREVRLPEELAQLPELYPAYVDVEHMVRGVYRGLIGWWANDTAELHPPHTEELGAEIVKGFGGAEMLLTRAQQVLQEKRYNLAAKLAAFVLAGDPENEEARKIKAAALRKMAQATPTGIQTRNFMLYEALQLEGKIGQDHAAGGVVALPIEMVAALPPTQILETLAYTIDGERASNLVATLKIELTDIDKSFALAVRHGATEILEPDPEDFDLGLVFDRRAWAEVFLGKKKLQELVDEGRATFTGDDGLKAAFLDAYHEVF